MDKLFQVSVPLTSHKSNRGVEVVHWVLAMRMDSVFLLGFSNADGQCLCLNTSVV